MRGGGIENGYMDGGIGTSAAIGHEQICMSLTYELVQLRCVGEEIVMCDLAGLGVISGHAHQKTHI